MARPSHWLASVMSGISSKPETPGSMAEFHPVTKHEDLSRVGPSIPCVEAAGSTAEPLRGAVTAGICPHCVRGIAVRRMDSPFHCQFCGGTGVKAVGCEPLGLRCQHEYESRSPDGDGLSETRSESVALQSVDPLSAPAGEKAEHKAVAGFAVTVPHEPRAGSEPADSLQPSALITDPTEPAITAIFDGAALFAKALAETATRDRAAQLRLRLEACLNQLREVYDAACFLEGQL